MSSKHVRQVTRQDVVKDAVAGGWGPTLRLCVIDVAMPAGGAVLLVFAAGRIPLDVLAPALETLLR